MNSTEYNQRYYQENKARVRDWQRAGRQRNKEFALQFLGGKCAKCGSDSELQFDHIDPNTICFRIATAAGLSRSLEHLIEELKKCQLLCAPCHREKTARENSARFKKPMQHGTLWAYHQKCRCDECVSAKRTYMRGWRNKNA